MLWGVILSIGTVIFFWASAIFVCLLLASKYRLVSAIWLGVAGLTAYSIPAFLGLSYLPETREIIEASDDAVMVMALVWLTYGIVAWAASFTYVNSELPEARKRRGDLHTFAICALIGYAVSFSLIAASSGPTFFIGRDRASAATEGSLAIAWMTMKWGAALLLLAAFQCKRRLLFLVAAGAIATVILGGDRTTPVIAVVGVLTLAFARTKLFTLTLKPQAWLALSVLLMIVFFSKPLYSGLATGRSVIDVISENSAVAFLMQWEAFVIHEIMERVVAHGFEFDMGQFLVGTIGQLFVVPSAIGVHSGQFNAAFQPELFPDVTFGLAYNLWAQWYAVLGWAGVVFGAGLFALTMVGLDRLIKRASGPSRILFTLLAALIGVYAHRNSLENVLALVRQVLVAFVPIWLFYLFVLTLRDKPRSLENSEKRA